MRCPYCGDCANRVIDSRLAREEAEIRRRRQCLECDRRFTTRERVEATWPKVVKRDGRREEFDPRRLRAGLEKALAKRPVESGTRDGLVDRVERRVQELGEPELQSARIGGWLLEELVVIDPMAASRFASVFQRFEGGEDYAAFFTSLPAKNGDSAETPGAGRIEHRRQRIS